MTLSHSVSGMSAPVQPWPAQLTCALLCSPDSPRGLTGSGPPKTSQTCWTQRDNIRNPSAHIPLSLSLQFFKWYRPQGNSRLRRSWRNPTWLSSGFKDQQVEKKAQEVWVSFPFLTSPLSSKSKHWSVFQTRDSWYLIERHSHTLKCTKNKPCFLLFVFNVRIKVIKLKINVFFTQWHHFYLMTSNVSFFSLWGRQDRKKDMKETWELMQ